MTKLERGLQLLKDLGEPHDGTGHSWRTCPSCQAHTEIITAQGIEAMGEVVNYIRVLTEERDAAQKQNSTDSDTITAQLGTMLELKVLLAEARRCMNTSNS